MENLKVIKDRIKTVGSIIKATNAMKMVSTVKLARVNNINKCSKQCAEILFDMFSRATRELIFEQETDYWFSPKNSREQGKSLIVILSIDQGFCGSFQQSLRDKAAEAIKQNPGAYVEVFGKKGEIFAQNALRLTEVRDKMNTEVGSHYDIAGYVKLLSGLVSKYVKEHSVSEVYVVSGEFRNVLVQKAKCQKVFPATEEDITKTQYTKIEGDRIDFMNAVFDMYLQKLFTGIVTEHLVAELSARVMAMDNSVRNARNMFEKLSGLYNKVRQAQITQELTEIVSSIECVQ